MTNAETFSIIDFGSSKLRLGVFDKYLPNSKYIQEESYKDKKTINANLKSLVLKTEKEINQHLKVVDIMLDNPKSFSVDLSIKKKIDNNLIDEKLTKHIIQDAKSIIEDNYNSFNIIHLIVSNSNLDGKFYENLPMNLIGNDLTLEIKFILLPKKIIRSIKELFKNNQITVKNFYNSSYLKSLNYIKYFDQFENKVFLDIGNNQTTLVVYKKEKIFFINSIPIGGANITKDISKILNLDIEKSERMKKNLKQSNTVLENYNSRDLLIKVIHARVEEIIDLSFKSLKNFEIFKNKNSILVFTGEGSRILSKNSIYLAEEYNFFNEMKFFEETSDTICSSGYAHLTNENSVEAIMTEKKPEKLGFFERLFYRLAR